MVASPPGPLPEEEGDISRPAAPASSPSGGAAYYNLPPTDVRARTGDPTANQDVDGDGRIDNVAVWQGALQVRAMWRGAALQAEYFQRLEHPGGVTADRGITRGEYAQASYFVIAHFLQVAAPIGRTDEPLLPAGRPKRVRQAIGTQRRRAGRRDQRVHPPGHAFKLQLDYSHLRAENVSAPRWPSYSPDAQPGARPGAADVLMGASALNGRGRKRLVPSADSRRIIG